MSQKKYTSKKYTSKATTTLIRATSRASIKIKDNFYTVEWSEERSVPSDADLEEERSLLWDTVNDEVDNQIQDIVDIYKSS